MAENKKITLDDLAAMVQNGFCDMDKKFDDKFDKVGSEIEVLKEGQERIELRLCNVAYKFDYVELEKRVAVLEQKNRAKSGK